MSPRSLLLAGLFVLIIWLVPTQGLAQSLQLQVIPETTEVAFGRAFQLKVVRWWSEGWTPDAWDDHSLDPLQLRTLAVTRRSENGRVRESRRFLCYAFQTGRVNIPALLLRARQPGSDQEEVTFTEPIALQVHSSLGPDQPARPELPGGPLTVPDPHHFRNQLLVALLAALALVLLLWLLRVTRSVSRAGSRLRTPPPETEEALEQLRAAAAGHPEQSESQLTRTSDLLRRLLHERFALGGPHMTANDLLADARVALRLPAPARSRLRAALLCLDQVRFGDLPTSAEHVTRALELALEFVRELDRHPLAAAPQKQVDPEGGAA